MGSRDGLAADPVTPYAPTVAAVSGSTQSVWRPARTRPTARSTAGATSEDTMPKSKVRKKAVYTAPADRRTPVKAKMAGPSHPVYISVMLGLMLIGLAWLVVTYLAVDKIPFMSSLGSWNFLVGFLLMIGGLLMTMRWR